MNPVDSSLENGHSEESILSFLSKTFPNIRNKILSSIKAGYSAKEILSFISKITQKQEKQQGGTESQILAQNIRQRDEKLENIAKTGAKLGATALGTYAISRAISPTLQTALQSALPNEQPQSNPTAPSEQLSNAPTQNPLPSDFNSKDLLESLKVNERVDNWSKKHSHEDIAEILNKYILKPEQKKWLKKQTEHSLDVIVKDYLEKKNSNPLVLLKSGQVGEIESEKDGISKIRIGDQVRDIGEENFVRSDISKKDLAELYKEVIEESARVSGEDVSRNVSWAGYDPKVNEFIYLPHDGGAYIYDNISEQDAKNLTEILTLRKTSGENFIGAWKKGSKSPIGSAMHAFIKKLQAERGGKGNEYVRKFHKIYDAFEVAKEAVKRKKKRK